MNTVLLIDSCCNLPDDYYERNSDVLALISMPIHLGDKDFYDDHGKTISHKDFYDHLRKGLVPSTSQITPQDFINCYEKHHSSGKRIIYIAFSSNMSGTYNNALMAKRMFLEDYPDAQIDIVDSLSASVGISILVMNAVEMIRDGKTDAVVQWVQDNRLAVNHKFTVADLMFLKNGGRIPPALAAIGTVLNLKPIMSVDQNGKLIQNTKVRGRKKVYRTFINHLNEKYTDKDSPIIIGHGDCYDDALTLRQLIEDEFAPNEIYIADVSPTIGAHVGPGLMLLGFLGDSR